MRDTSNALIFVAKLPLDQWIRYGGQLEKNEMAVFFRVGVPEYLGGSCHLENKLLLISINFTPKTSHSCLKKMVH